jgi:hypothetical protein
MESLVTLKRTFIPNVRNQVTHWAIQGVVDEREKQDFVYLETRPEVVSWQPPIRVDCSFYCKIVYWRAGAIDPTGMNFDEYGNSDSIFNNPQGKHINLADVRHGDIILFGPGGSTCASMGQPGNPALVKLSVLESLGEATFIQFPMTNRHLMKLPIIGNRQI